MRSCGLCIEPNLSTSTSLCILRQINNGLISALTLCALSSEIILNLRKRVFFSEIGSIGLMAFKVLKPAMGEAEVVKGVKNCFVF